MFEQGCNFSLNLLSSIIGESIEYFTICKKKRYVNEPAPTAEPTFADIMKDAITKGGEIIKIKKQTQEDQAFLKKKAELKKNKIFSEELMFICSASVCFLGKKINQGTKRKIYFENIKGIEVLPGEEGTITFKLKNPIKKQNKIEYKFLIKDPGTFIENINGKYQIYCVKKNGIPQDLNINVNYFSTLFSGVLSLMKKNPLKKEETLTSQKSIFCDKFDQEKEEDDEIIALQNHKFYLDKYFQQRKNNPSIFVSKIKEKSQGSETIAEGETPTEYIEESFQKNNPKIGIFIKKESLIENCWLNSTNKSLKFCASTSLNDYLKSNYPENSTYFIKTPNKLKKPRIEGDISRWKGYRYEIKFKPKKNIGYNIMFYYIRRMFIPPFFESYNDFIIILKEEYNDNETNKNFSQCSMKAVDKIVNSLRPIQIMESNEVTKEIVKMKLESFLVNQKTLEFLYQTVDIKGKESYKLSVDYKIKLGLLYEEFENSKITFDYITELQQYFASEDIDVDIIQYLKKLQFTQLEELIDKTAKNLRNYFSMNDNQTQIIYRTKIINFISYIITSKILAKGLFDRILNLSKRLNDFAEVIYPIMNYLINFQVINDQSQIMSKTISEIVNEISTIEKILYNEDLLCLFISNGLLKKLQGIESDLVYFQFLNHILINNFSFKLLNAIYMYLEMIKKSISSKSLNDNVAGENSLAKNSKILVETFIKFYSDKTLNPQVIALSCKCLIILSYLYNRNKEIMRNEEFYGFLYKNFSSSDQMILYYSIQLFDELTQAKCDQTKIIENSNGFLFKLVNIFRGMGIEGCYYHPELILLVLKFLKKLVDNSQIRNMLISPKNRKFVKYLFKYIYNFENNFAGYDNVEDYYLGITTNIYELLRQIIGKNIEIKKYINTNFHLIKLINERCDDYSSLIYELGRRSNYKIQDLILSLFYFLEDFIGTDLILINEAKYSCKKLLLLIIEYGNYLTKIPDSKKYTSSKATQLQLCERLIKLFNI